LSSDFALKLSNVNSVVVYGVNGALKLLFQSVEAPVHSVEAFVNLVETFSYHLQSVANNFANCVTNYALDKRLDLIVDSGVNGAVDHAADNFFDILLGGWLGGGCHDFTIGLDPARMQKFSPQLLKNLITYIVLGRYIIKIV
jgi:hypothetical protein